MYHMRHCNVNGHDRAPVNASLKLEVFLLLFLSHSLVPPPSLAMLLSLLLSSTYSLNQDARRHVYKLTSL